MRTWELPFGILIVAVTAGLGGYYAWRQWQTLRRLRSDESLDADEHAFQRNQAWRRLAGAVLLLLIAGLFVVVLFFQGPADRLLQAGRENAAAAQEDQQHGLNEQQRHFMHVWVGTVIVLLLLLLGLLGIAGYEIFAIRRYSVRQMRRIQDERRAMIASETARLRRERNGNA